MYNDTRRRVCQQACPVGHLRLAHVLDNSLPRNAYAASLAAAHQVSMPGVGGAAAPFTTFTAPISAARRASISTAARRRRGNTATPTSAKPNARAPGTAAKTQPRRNYGALYPPPHKPDALHCEEWRTFPVFFSFFFLRGAEEWRLDFTQRRVK